MTGHLTMFSKNLARLITMSLTLALVSACTQHHALKSPANPSDKFYGNIDENGERVKHQANPSELFATDLDCSDVSERYANVHYRVDKVIDGLAKPLPSRSMQRSLISGELSLSPGDLLELHIENGEGFNGRYIISAKGALNIPYVKPINVRGLDVYEAAEKIELSLVRAELFQPSTIAINLQVLEWAEIDVMVSGAVFSPGRQYINQKKGSLEAPEKLRAHGDFSSSRYLSEALRAASGIRPDAKIDQIILIRNGWQYEVDMSGVLTGATVNDVPLIAGDQVVVPTTGCFQKHLARPSQITPKGFRVFMSNLIDSAASNSSAGVGSFSTSLPYGSRLLQAAISANCVGGKQWTNAPRKVVLASTNPVTGRYQVVERSVEDLLRQAHDETQNPYLLPNDSVACYDSDITNVRDMAGFMLDMLLPIKLL
jgi:polysaccharide biosynthesis/export protein